MDQPRIKLYAMAAAYNDGEGNGVVVSGTWLAWNEQCACGEFVSKYYTDGGKYPLVGVCAIEVTVPQVRGVLDVLEKNEPARRGEVVRLVPQTQAALYAAGASDNLRPVSTKFLCRYASDGTAGITPPCSGMPNAFCPHCEAVTEAAADPA